MSAQSRRPDGSHRADQHRRGLRPSGSWRRRRRAGTGSSTTPPTGSRSTRAASPPAAGRSRCAARRATTSPSAPRRPVDLAGEDVVWLRQDPPFDMGYITTTHILERIHPATLVVNDPFWVRNYPEKLLVLGFPELTPPTIVARDLATLKAFKARHGDIILKPLYGNGGAGVFRLDPNDRNFNALWELFAGINREPLIAQKFLPAVADGDKRIILVDGEAVGAINRVPLEGETRSNMHAGGRPEKIAMSDARPRDLRRHRPAPAREGADLRRHRRDRRLADRDQRHLAHRPAGARALRRHQRHRADLGSDRAAARLMRPDVLAALGARRLAAAQREAAPRARALDRGRARPDGGGRGAGLPAAVGPLAGGAPARRPAARRPPPAGARRRRACCSGCTAAPTASARRAPTPTWPRRWRAGRGRARSCPTTGSPPSTLPRRRRRRPRRLGGAPRRGPAPPARIALGGDSAGGGLAFALLHLLLAAGAPPPACVVAFSPWVDLTLAGASLRRLARRDALLPARRLARGPRPVPRRRRPARPARLAAPRPLPRRAAGAHPGQPRRDPARRRPADGGAARGRRRAGDARPRAGRARTSGRPTTAGCPRPPPPSTAPPPSSAPTSKARDRRPSP